MLAPSLMAGAGAAGGSLLGQLGDALSAPRRAAWGLLGLPEHGADLVAGAIPGIERDSATATILGLLAEMVGDPMTWAGGALMGKAGNIMRAAKGAPLAEEALSAHAARTTAQEAIDAAAGRVAEAGGAEGIANRFGSMRPYLSPESLASGAERTYTAPGEGVADLVKQFKLGTVGDEGAVTLQGGLKRNLSHADRYGAPGVQPDMLGSQGTSEIQAAGKRGTGGKGGGRTLTIRPDAVPDVPPSDAEFDLLRQASKEVGALPGGVTSIHTPDPFAVAAQKRMAQLGDTGFNPEIRDIMDVRKARLLDLLSSLPAEAGIPQGLGLAAAAGGLGGLSYGVGNKLWGQKQR